MNQEREQLIRREATATNVELRVGALQVWPGVTNEILWLLDQERDINRRVKDERSNREIEIKTEERLSHTYREAHRIAEEDLHTERLRVQAKEKRIIVLEAALREVRSGITEAFEYGREWNTDNATSTSKANRDLARETFLNDMEFYGGRIDAALSGRIEEDEVQTEEPVEEPEPEQVEEAEPIQQ